jgi:TetR/AcrR family transcriptional regulator, regulator of autoinduction and epiphytic fitness
MTTSASVTDGRSARSQRTREAVVDALLVLIREGCPRPTARQIAERANVSLRSVYVHFDDLEDLFFAAAQRTTQRITEIVEPISPQQQLAARIEAVCDMRARIYEEVGPVRRAAELQAPFSPLLSRLLTNVRKLSWDGLVALFAAELDPLDAPARQRRLGALDTALSPESWDLLRFVHGLSCEDALATIVEHTSVLLGETTR